MDDLKYCAELALVNSVPTMFKEGLKKGRLKSQFDKMSRITNKELRKFHLNDDQFNWLAGKLDAFGEACGWHGKERHAATIVSFCISLVDRSDKFPQGVMDAMNNVIDYYERAGNLPYQSCWAGDIAMKKWEGLFV